MMSAKGSAYRCHNSPPAAIASPYPTNAHVTMIAGRAFHRHTYAPSERAPSMAKPTIITDE